MIGSGKMEFVYNKTAIGYSHINKNIVCQDFSDYYINENVKVITACDGHGGNLYIRSNRGAEFASQAVVDVIKQYDEKKLEELINDNILEKLKLEILCKWNELIEQDYSNEPFSEEELSCLDEEEMFKLNSNYISAYGTTLNSVIATSNYLICVQIGDGGVYLLGKESVELAFPDNDENVANITNSLCGDNAYDNIYIDAFIKDDYIGVVICSDGLLGPYQTYENFNNSFISPFVNNFQVVTEEAINNANQFIEDLGEKDGIGDDVSVACILY